MAAPSGGHGADTLAAGAEEALGPHHLLSTHSDGGMRPSRAMGAQRRPGNCEAIRLTGWEVRARVRSSAYGNEGPPLPEGLAV